MHRPACKERRFGTARVRGRVRVTFCPRVIFIFDPCQYLTTVDCKITKHHATQGPQHVPQVGKRTGQAQYPGTQNFTDDNGRRVDPGGLFQMVVGFCECIVVVVVVAGHQGLLFNAPRLGKGRQQQETAARRHGPGLSFVPSQSIQSAVGGMPTGQGGAFSA